MKAYATLAFLVGALGTCLVLFLSYFRFSYLDIGWGAAVEQFLVWPWVLFPLLLTGFTMCIPFITMALLGRHHQRRSEYHVIYCCLAPPLAVLIAYPGLDRLGVHSDGSGNWVYVGSWIFQSIALWLVARGLEHNQSNGEQDVAPQSTTR